MEARHSVVTDTDTSTSCGSPVLVGKQRGAWHLFGAVRLVLNGADVPLVGRLVHQSIQLCGLGNGHLHQPTYGEEGN